MKHSISTICFLVLSFSLDAQTPDWGKADTLAHYSPGPGTVFTHIHFPQKPLAVYLVKVDLSHPYNTIESYQSNNRVPDRSLQRTSDQCIANSYEGHRTIAGVNHDFFDAKGGIAIGTNIRNGEMTHNGEWQNGQLINRAALLFDTNKRMTIIQPTYISRFIFSDGSKLKIDMVNDRADNLHDSKPVTLYNRYCTKPLTAQGTYVKLSPIEPWLFNGAPTRCEVLEVSSTPIQPSAESYVVRLVGNESTSIFMEHIVIGDPLKGIIQVEQLVNGVNWGAATSNVKQVFHGYPSIIRNGKLHTGEYDNFENGAQWPLGRSYEVTCRTMAGISRDGKQLFLIVVDGRRPSWSVGINCIEAGQYLVEQGAWHVVNFDSGGSSAMAINNQLINRPSDVSGERTVINTLQALSLAPTDANELSVAFKCPRIDVEKGAIVKIDYLTYNRYDDLAAENSTSGKVSFRISEGLSSTISPTGVLSAGNRDESGYVIASIENQSDTLRVKIGAGGAITSVVSPESAELMLYCAPSVVEQSALIHYTLPEATSVRLSLVSLTGNETILSEGYQQAGRYNKLLNASSLNSGIYIVKLATQRADKTTCIVVK